MRKNICKNICKFKNTYVSLHRQNDRTSNKTDLSKSLNCF